jgi:hypothetical protein
MGKELSRKTPLLNLDILKTVRYSVNMKYFKLNGKSNVKSQAFYKTNEHTVWAYEKQLDTDVYVYGKCSGRYPEFKEEFKDDIEYITKEDTFLEML